MQKPKPLFILFSFDKKILSTFFCLHSPELKRKNAKAVNEVFVALGKKVYLLIG